MCDAEIKVRMKSITKTCVQRGHTLFTTFGEKEVGKNWFACNNNYTNINKALNAVMLTCHRQGTFKFLERLLIKKI